MSVSINPQNKFSIVLPVHNGGSMIKDCVASILAQSLPDFNLIVLENASTDGTAAWLHSLNDKRIVIYESETLLPIEENWRRARDIQLNEYMMYIGHDDILAENYLSVMDELVKQHPRAGLYGAHFAFIDEKGKQLRSCKPVDETEDAPTFLKKVFTGKKDVNATGYMMRSADYIKTGGMPAYPCMLFADLELWLRLTGISYLAAAKETCFYFRVHESTTATAANEQWMSAFERFVRFVAEAGKNDTAMQAVILQYAKGFFIWCTRMFSYKLLQTLPGKDSRMQFTSFLQRMDACAVLLLPGNSTAITSIPTVRIARLIEGNKVLLNIYRQYRKWVRT